MPTNSNIYFNTYLLAIRFMAILFDVKIQKQTFALSIYFIISSLTGLRVVHKLRLQDEVTFVNVYTIENVNAGG